MIDTIKIYTEIDKNIYNKIKSLSIVKSSMDYSSGELQYEIINDHLEGSFDSRLSVKVDCGSKYQFVNKGYCIEIEGSFHKIVKGYNSHNGYYDLEFVCKSLIEFAELSYNVKLPDFMNWYLQRCDIAITYDLKDNQNVKQYINSLSKCRYPRRNIKFYYDESCYLSGTTTTLKIYNKLLEFKKHDLKKFNNKDFNLIEYLKQIDGFVRFECEIKKKKLQQIYNCKHIEIYKIKYVDLKKVWSDEFMKLLDYIKNDLNIVRSREEVLERLQNFYRPSKANLLFNFYCSIQLNGKDEVKKNYSSSTFYRYISDLKNARVDFSQSYILEQIELFTFNPFECKEVA